MENLLTLLENLGISRKEAEVYSILYRTGNLTLLQLSQLTRIPRTTVYRLVESLRQKAIVEEVIDGNSRKIHAVSIDRLEILISKEREKLHKAEALYPFVKELMEKQPSAEIAETKVTFFKGIDGLKQQIWNELRTSTELLSFTYLNLDKIYGHKFALKYRTERTSRKIYQRDLISSDDPELTEENIRISREDVLFRNYDWRYLPADAITIDHQVTIYDDIVSFYHWSEEDIFGIEIRNKSISRLQRQLFEFLWKLAEKPESVLKMRNDGKPAIDTKLPVRQKTDVSGDDGT